MKKSIPLLMALSIFILGFQYPEQNLTALLSNSTKANDDLESIYDLDVFNFYKLGDYDTELKKETYKKTTDYQNYLSELKGKRLEMLKSTYYVVEHPPIPDYDTTRKGFEIELFATWGIGTYGAWPQTNSNQSFNGILFKALPMYSKKVFLQLDEKAGVEIENDRAERGSNPNMKVSREDKPFMEMKAKRVSEDEPVESGIGIYYFFIPTGKEKTSFKFTDINTPSGVTSAYYIYSDKVRVIVANEKTGRIYFDKNYVYPPPTAQKK